MSAQRPPVRIERQSDGRHAVMDANGRVLGLHNSPWSAARQMHEYYPPDTNEPNARTKPKKIPAAKIPRPRESAGPGPIPARPIPKP